MGGTPDLLESQSVDASIFQQTQEEISLGRMTPLASPDLTRPLTRRVGVLQRTAKGVVKTRCIDDFAESLVNDTVTTSRRICMGRLTDTLAVTSVMIFRPAGPASIVFQYIKLDLMR